MSKTRNKTSLIHIKDGVKHEVSKEKKTGKLFIKTTDIEVAPNQVCRKNNSAKSDNYDFSKPYQAQELGDEWSDYAWSADDY